MARDLEVLLFKDSVTVQDQYDNMSKSDGVQRVISTQLLKLLSNFCLSSQACRIIDPQSSIMPLDINTDGVTCDARFWSGKHPVFTHKAIDQRTFAHVRSSNHRKLQWFVIIHFNQPLGFIWIDFFRQTKFNIAINQYRLIGTLPWQ